MGKPKVSERKKHHSSRNIKSYMICRLKDGEDIPASVFNRRSQETRNQIRKQALDYLNSEQGFETKKQIQAEFKIKGDEIPLDVLDLMELTAIELNIDEFKEFFKKEFPVGTEWTGEEVCRKVENICEQCPIGYELYELEE